MGIPQGLFAAGPEALPRALGAWDAWRRLGTPQGELALAWSAVRLTRAPESNAVYRGCGEAGEGEGYRCAHDDPDVVRELACLPPGPEVRRYCLAPRPGDEEQSEAERT